jgi:hypothetical protein
MAGPRGQRVRRGSPGFLPRTTERLLRYDKNVSVYDGNWIVRNVGEWAMKETIRPVFDEVDNGQPGS